MIKQAKGLLPKLQVGINLCMSLLPQPPEAKKKSGVVHHKIEGPQQNLATLQVSDDAVDTSVPRSSSPAENIDITVASIYSD